MKIIVFLGVLATSGVYGEVSQRDIPLKRIPVCETWIPEGRSWGCVNLRRRDMADRETIEALVLEIRELKQRIELLENEKSNI